MSEQLTGSTSPPMTNGELVFETPWQGRIFGMAKTLADRGVITWDDFRQELIAQIARAEQADSFDYYRCFQAALEAVLLKKEILEAPLLAQAIDEIAAKGHGHG